MDYRKVVGSNADDLVERLSLEAKQGDWKVVGLVKDGSVFVAILEGTPYERTPPSTPAMTEWEQTVEDELKRIDGERPNDESE